MAGRPGATGDAFKPAAPGLRIGRRRTACEHGQTGQRQRSKRDKLNAESRHPNSPLARQPTASRTSCKGKPAPSAWPMPQAAPIARPTPDCRLSSPSSPVAAPTGLAAADLTWPAAGASADAPPTCSIPALRAGIVLATRLIGRVPASSYIILSASLSSWAVHPLAISTSAIVAGSSGTASSMVKVTLAGSAAPAPQMS